VENAAPEVGVKPKGAPFVDISVVVVAVHNHHQHRDHEKYTQVDSNAILLGHFAGVHTTTDKNGCFRILFL